MNTILLISVILFHQISKEDRKRIPLDNNIKYLCAFASNSNVYILTSLQQ